MTTENTTPTETDDDATRNVAMELVLQTFMFACTFVSELMYARSTVQMIVDEATPLVFDDTARMVIVNPSLAKRTYTLRELKGFSTVLSDLPVACVERDLHTDFLKAIVRHLNQVDEVSLTDFVDIAAAVQKGEAPAPHPEPENDPGMEAREQALRSLMLQLLNEGMDLEAAKAQLAAKDITSSSVDLDDVKEAFDRARSEGMRISGAGLILGRPQTTTSIDDSRQESAPAPQRLFVGKGGQA